MGYFFDLPTCAREAECPVKSGRFGTDYPVKRAECVLLPAFDSWRSGSKLDATQPSERLAGFSLDTAPTDTSPDWTRERNHDVGFRMVGGHILKDGRRLGSVRVTAIDAAVVDALYERQLVVKETDANGKTVERERRTTINELKSCRRPWKIAARRNPGKVPTLAWSRLSRRSSVTKPV